MESDENLLCRHRHRTVGALSAKYQRQIDPNWACTERLSTTCATLCLCLNPSVPPPTVIKPKESAVLECWKDPTKMNPKKASETIIKALKGQYVHWLANAHYSLCFDPTPEEIKKSCLSSRQFARDERVLFHYNGHGVPNPTEKGDLWAFNKELTQYTHLQLGDLQAWLGVPSVLLFDCNHAGRVIETYLKILETRSKEKMGGGNTSYMNSVILFGSCRSNECLPLSPDYPADLFTSCLTTPVKTAVKWFCLNASLQQYPPDTYENLKGSISIKKTMLGDLHWLLTTITDTIAWDILPKDMFQRLFRQDSLVASFFRNFILAERIFHSFKLSPVSYPPLPSSYNHPLWSAWDLAVELSISQLSKMNDNCTIEYQPSPFFSSQATSFEVWLDWCAVTQPTNFDPPMALPILLQVLLNQEHRLRALQLLARFLDLGEKAVYYAMCVGMSLYFMKILISSGPEHRDTLVFIWTKILAFNHGCKISLISDNCTQYFIGYLKQKKTPADIKIKYCFILATIMDNSPAGQDNCFHFDIYSALIPLLSDPNAMLRKWAVLCLARLWDKNYQVRARAWNENVKAIPKLCMLLQEPSPEVRASILYALGCFIDGGKEEEQENNLNIGLTILNTGSDASPLVRKELIIALSKLISSNKTNFANATKSANANQNTIFSLIWKGIINELTQDPSLDVLSTVNALVTSVNDGSFAPLTSNFFEWCSEYFQKPLLGAGVVDKTSAEYKKYVFRKQNNAKLIKDAPLSYDMFERHKKFKKVNSLFDKSFENEVPKHVCFSSFDNFLVAANDKDSIRIWDYSTCKIINSFSNLNPLKSRITSIFLINEQTNPLLCVGSNDGVLRVWNGITSRSQIITTFRALPDIVQHRELGAGLIAARSTADPTKLMTTGDVSVVRIWDIERELATSIINTNCDNGVTAISSDRSGGYLFVIGCGDGRVKVFDPRVQDAKCCVSTLSESNGWVLNVIMPTSGQIVYGAVTGQLKFWNGSSQHSHFATTVPGLTAVDCHNYAPFVATGSSQKKTTIYNMNGENVTFIEYHENFFGQRISPVSCLSFHPYTMSLAVGCSDACTTVYSASASN